MARNLLRVVAVLALIVIVVFGPFVYAGYAELHQASRSGSYVEAAQHYQAAAQHLPWRADLYELAGHAYYHAQKYIEADGLYRIAFSRRTLSPQGWVAWGDVNYLNDDPQRATEIWNEALEQNDPSDELYSRLARMYQSAGEFPQAVEYLQKYLSAHPEDADAHYRLGILLIVSDPDRGSTELADAARLDRELDPAVQTLRTALNLASLSGSDSERFVILGRGLGLVNEWQLAYVIFEKAVAANEENAEAWAWLGEAKQQTRAPEGGSTEIERAFALNPNLATIRGLRGLYFQRTGNFRAALAEFQAAAQLEPSNPAWFVSIGEAYARLGDLIRALEAYQAATKLAPKEPKYWRLLANFCAQNNINISDVGLPAAQQVVILGEVDSTSIDLVGWLLTLASRYDEAERLLMRALELDPKNASAHLHLGMLYLQTDKFTQSQQHFIQARDLGSEEAARILEQYFP